MDGDRDRKPRTTAMTPAGRGGGIATMLTCVLVALAVAGVGYSAWSAPGSDEREATGWMYREVALVPEACPPLAGEVRAIAAKDLMTVGDAKRIAERLRATSKAADDAWGRYNGRRAMGMGAGRPPLVCHAADPRYEGYDIPILENFKFRIADQEAS